MSDSFEVYPRATLRTITVNFGIFTVCNEVAKVMFLQACVCPHGGGVSASVHAGTPHPPQEQTPGVDTPRSRHAPERRPLLRTVRILLECILVYEKVHLNRAQRKLQKATPDSYPSYYSPVHYHILGDFSMRIAVCK